MCQKSEGSNMTPTIPNIHDIDALLEYLPYFQDQNNEFHQVINKPPQVPYYDYSNTVDNFYHDLYHRNMILGFDWTQWTDEGQKYIKMRELLATADITVILKLFTLIIRSDRFTEGLLGDMIDNGFILDLLVRLKGIRGEIEDRFHGAIIGLAVGDCLGVPLEFTDPGSFQPVNDMMGGGPFNLDPGMWD